MRKKKLYIVVGIAGFFLFQMTFYITVRLLTSVTLNLCYSDAIDALSQEVLMRTQSRNAIDFQRIEVFLEGIPLRGYETKCNDVQIYIKTIGNIN